MQAENLNNKNTGILFLQKNIIYRKSIFWEAETLQRTGQNNNEGLKYHTPQ